MWSAIAAAGLASAAAYVGYAAAHPAAQVWGRGFYRGPREGRLISLTFDDGPNDATAPILDLLAEYDAKATFFVCGRCVERRADLSRRAVAEGHEIGNHTDTHPLLPLLSGRRVFAEVETAQKTVEDQVGVSPTLFRPPFGMRAPSLPPALEAHGLETVHWTVIGRDWSWTADRVAARVLKYADPGGIVCLHDGREAREEADRRETVKALAEILPVLARQGYRFVTASEMRKAAILGTP